MRIQALRRHPVKSVAGESLDTADVEPRGMVGDRVWALYLADGGIASGKNSRRFRRVEGLLQWASVLPDGGVPELVDPAGARLAADDPAAPDTLAAAFGVRLEPRVEQEIPHFDDAPLHLVTTSSLEALAREAGGEVDARRTRANVVVDTGDAPEWVEDAWLGREFAFGEQVVLRVTAPMPRCVMVDMAHRGVAAAPAVLKPLGRAHGVELGVMAEVVRPGRLRVGDSVVPL